MATLPDRRALVLARLLKGKVDREEAALLLGLSERSVRRLSARLVENGPAALVHGNTGRRPANALDPQIVARVVAFAKDGYAGLNDTHLGELLAEREGVAVSRPSVQRILRAAGIESPRKRRAPRFRSRRARRAAEGELVQLDASRHHWIGPRGPELALLGAIDDATGKIIAAVFREQEDAAGYLMVLAQLLAHGVPTAVYSDRHSVFWIKARDGETLLDEQGRERQPTQLGRAFAELGVEMIFASSPQAKGRVERLWGTLQDRLLAEMRLERIATIEAANTFLARYLERHNGRFAVAAADATAAWRPLPAGLAVDDVCCLKYARHVAADNTVTHEGVVVQLPPRVRGTYAHLRVEVRHHLDGSVSVHLPGGKQLARSVAGAAMRLRPKAAVRAPVGGVRPDPRNVDRSHPWRQWRPGQMKTKLHVPRSELA